MSVIEAPQPPALSTIETPADPDARVPTVLIVDDSPVDRRLVAAIVARNPGLRPVVANDGGEALEMIAGSKPSVVVTDIQMPGIDGLELVKAIRRVHPDLPVILMTAYGSEDVAFQALRAGATHYVPKKSLATELAGTIDAVLAAAARGDRGSQLLRCVERSVTSWRLANDGPLIAALIASLQEELAGMGVCDGGVRTRVGVALGEALANAMFHGNLEVSSDLRQEDERIFHALADARRETSPYRDRRIDVSAEIDRDSATFRIRDEGPGFDTSGLDAPFDPESLTRIGGRGMILIRAFVDEVRHNASGNEITLVVRRKSA
ncbi:response regulator [Paludisphaera mucosa]|uniref:Response regulator n=1 Tax=Paludisphaera mucosa TaxID=3030827 RepID=A0ABT6FD15_9BACT|nr:response regulator [Paludisphaera mucosa]MDG3005466.1 response regulator [Paludisphaera mucosa]